MTNKNKLFEDEPDTGAKGELKINENFAKKFEFNN